MQAVRTPPEKPACLRGERKAAPFWVHDRKSGDRWRAMVARERFDTSDSLGRVLCCDVCGDNIHWNLCVLLKSVEKEHMEPVASELLETCRSLAALFAVVYASQVPLPQDDRKRYEHCMPEASRVMSLSTL